MEAIAAVRAHDGFGEEKRDDADDHRAKQRVPEVVRPRIAVDEDGHRTVGHLVQADECRGDDDWREKAIEGDTTKSADQSHLLGELRWRKRHLQAGVVVSRWRYRRGLLLSHVFRTMRHAA